ncbi:hypothetical protein LIS04_47 [Listeria phage LIS04]|nr:hypothetical protein LIS04_47 [Listeria phage LIS04]
MEIISFSVIIKVCQLGFSVVNDQGKVKFLKGNILYEYSEIESILRD